MGKQEFMDPKPSSLITGMGLSQRRKGSEKKRYGGYNYKAEKRGEEAPISGNSELRERCGSRKKISVHKGNRSSL